MPSPPSRPSVNPMAGPAPASPLSFRAKHSSDPHAALPTPLLVKRAQLLFALATQSAPLTQAAPCCYCTHTLIHRIFHTFSSLLTTHPALPALTSTDCWQLPLFHWETKTTCSHHGGRKSPPTTGEPMDATWALSPFIPWCRPKDTAPAVSPLRLYHVTHPVQDHPPPTARKRCHFSHLSETFSRPQVSLQRLGSFIRGSLLPGLPEPSLPGFSCTTLWKWSRSSRTSRPSFYVTFQQQHWAQVSLFLHDNVLPGFTGAARTHLLLLHLRLPRPAFLADSALTHLSAFTQPQDLGLTFLSSAQTSPLHASCFNPTRLVSSLKASQT